MVSFHAPTRKMFARWFHEFDPYYGGLGKHYITFRFEDVHEWHHGTAESLRRDLVQRRVVRSPNLSLPVPLHVEAQDKVCGGQSTAGLTYDIETNGSNQDFVSPFAGQFPFIRTEPRGVDKNNIAPRIGFAWDPTGNAETVVRGGFGIFYDALVMYPLAALESSSGIRRATVFFPGTTDIDAIFSGIDPATAPALIWPTGDIQSPMTRQFSLGVQHTLPGDIVVRVDGIYTEARNLLIERNLATVDPMTFVPAFPGFDLIGQILSEGEAEAKMLLVEARKAFSRGWVSLSYTLADRKNTTDAWNDFSAQVDPNSQDFSSEWGPAAWDERHRLIATGGVDLPYGLNITAKTVYSSARPYSAFTGTDDNGDGNRDGRLNDRPPGRAATHGEDRTSSVRTWDSVGVRPYEVEHRLASLPTCTISSIPRIWIRRR